MNFGEMQALLQTRLKPKRFEHVMGVVRSAEILAKHFGANVEKAKLAALLHDCGRQYPTHMLVEEARKRNLRISKLEAQLPILLHARIGACVAQEDYGVQDSEILKAIAAHTVGSAKMSILDKVLYLADMIEEHRSFPGLEVIRYAAMHEPLDKVMIMALDHSIKFIIRKGHTIHPYTVAARNSILLDKEF